MTKYVLDSSSLIRYVDNEAGAARVEEILGECIAGQATICLSAIQWGEVAGNLRKRMGGVARKAYLSGLLPSETEIVPVSAECAVRAGDLRVDRKIAYADAFALRSGNEIQRSRTGNGGLRFQGSGRSGAD